MGIYILCGLARGKASKAPTSWKDLTPQVQDESKWLDEAAFHVHFALPPCPKQAKRNT